MDATTADRRRRRLMIAVTAAGLALLVLVGVDVYGLLRGRATSADHAPSGGSTSAATATPVPSTGAAPAPIPRGGGPETFARNVATALFAWDTTTGNSPSDYAQILADVAHESEADAFVSDVRGYLPTSEAWGQLRQYATRQWPTIEEAVVPDAWATAVAQAAPGQIPDGAVAYTITGTRHRDGTWGTQPMEASRPVSFTVFVVCTPPIPSRNAAGLCEVLRLSELDNPLR